MSAYWYAAGIGLWDIIYMMSDAVVSAVDPDQLFLRRVSIDKTRKLWSCYHVHPTPMALSRRGARWYIASGFESYYHQRYKQDWAEWEEAHQAELNQPFPTRRAALLTLQALLATSEDAPPALTPLNALRPSRRGNGTYLLEGASLQFVLRPSSTGWEARQMMDRVEDIDTIELTGVSTRVGFFASLWEATAELTLVDMGHEALGVGY